jgi:hypothetical protein
MAVSLLDVLFTARPTPQAPQGGRPYTAGALLTAGFVVYFAGRRARGRR